MFTDTGSLIYEIQSEDVYDNFFKYKHLFDFSNYPKDSKFFDPTNKKVIGYWQNERQVWRKNNWWVCWIRLKMVFYRNIDGKESNTAKGVNIVTKFNEFRDTLWLSLMNLETLYLIKKYSDTKWKEFKVRNINLEHTKSRKYNYLALTIKDLF